MRPLIALDHFNFDKRQRMKKKLACAAFVSVLSAPAFSQSNVTLYGVIDTSLTYVSNTGRGAGRLFEMESGAVQGSRWGLKGVEELGGGLQALFQIENGFNSNDGTLGQGGLMFGRQAFVGLQGASWGTLTFGRQYDPIVDLIADNMPYSHAGDVDNTDNSFRVNNSVKFVSPRFGGLAFEGMYAFGGVAGAFGQRSTIAGGASYRGGPFYLTAAYLYARNPAAQFADGNFVANNPDNPAESGPFGFIGTPSAEQIVGATAAYTLGSATLGFAYTNAKFYNANGTTGTVRFDNYQLWGRYLLTAAVSVAGGYTFSQGDVGYLASNNRPRYSQINLFTNYMVSKRTDVYLKLLYQYAGGGVPAHVIGTSGNARQLVARVGLRHLF